MSSPTVATFNNRMSLSKHPWRKSQHGRDGDIPTIRCLILGDVGSGRRSLALRLRDGIFPSETPRRSDALVQDFGRVPYSIGRMETSVSLRVFSPNSVGVTNVPASPASYLELTDLLLLCCPTSRPAKEMIRHVIDYWMPYLARHGPHPLPRLLLVGTQCDRRAEEGLTESNGMALASAVGAAGYVECSALSGVAMEKLMKRALSCEEFAERRRSGSDSSEKRKVKRPSGCPIQ